jgi:plastocyanin
MDSSNIEEEVREMRKYQLAFVASLFICCFLSAVAEAGTLVGTVTISERRQARVAQRYSDSGIAESRELAAVPTIVFIKGEVPGFSIHDMPHRYVIEQRDFTFTPSFAVVPVGADVDFPNLDDEYHNAFSYSKSKRFDLGRYPKGESKTVEFDRAGVVKIYCEIHPWMRAAVVVVENPFFSVVEIDGGFKIANLPPGTYTVVAWNIDGGATESTVQVPDTGVTEIDVKLAGGVDSAIFIDAVPVGIARSASNSDDMVDCCEPEPKSRRP